MSPTCCLVLFWYTSICTVDCIASCIVVPFIIFTYGIPLCLCSLKSNFGKGGAIREGIIADARYTVTDCYIFQRSAFMKSPTVNARHAVTNHNVIKSVTTIKSPTANARHAVRYCHTYQSTAIAKSIIANILHAIWNSDLC